MTQKRRKQRVEPVFVSLAASKPMSLDREIFVCGFGKTHSSEQISRNRVKDINKNPDLYSFRTFNLMVTSDNLGSAIFKWLTDLGFDNKSAREAVKAIGIELGNILEEIGPPN